MFKKNGRIAVSTETAKTRPKYAFGAPLPEVGEYVWAWLTKRRKVQGRLVRRLKKKIMIHPEGGVDISIDNPE